MGFDGSGSGCEAATLSNATVNKGSVTNAYPNSVRTHRRYLPAAAARWEPMGRASMLNSIKAITLNCVLVGELDVQLRRVMRETIDKRQKYLLLCLLVVCPSHCSESLTIQYDMLCSFLRLITKSALLEILLKEFISSKSPYLVRSAIPPMVL